MLMMFGDVNGRGLYCAAYKRDSPILMMVMWVMKPSLLRRNRIVHDFSAVVMVCDADVDVGADFVESHSNVAKSENEHGKVRMGGDNEQYEEMKGRVSER